MQEACRTSIRNSTGNSESMILTSGPPHGWPGSGPPHGWVSGYCPDWQERAGWHRRRCGECSKNISDLYGIHYKKTLALPGSSTLEFLILPIPDMGGGPNPRYGFRYFPRGASAGLDDVPKIFQLLCLIILHPIRHTKQCPKSDLLGLPLVAPT